MEKSFQTPVPDMRPTPEQPRNTVLLTLPEFDIYGQKTRLGMHTDTFSNFIRAVGSLGIRDLQVQGRVLTPEQLTALQNNKAYQFFMNGRLQRVDIGQQAPVLSFLYPKDLTIGEDDAHRMMGMPFSPTTLAGELGYQVGYYNVQDLVQAIRQGESPNAYLPILAGSNEFQLGSNTLTRHQLEQLAQFISQRLLEMDQNLLSLLGSYLSPTGITSIQLNTPPSSIIPTGITSSPTAMRAAILQGSYSMINFSPTSIFKNITFNTYKKEIFNDKNETKKTIPTSIIPYNKINNNLIK